jgi:uncharacterized membrane protein YphA (DoxX/SURF4 family)
MKRTVISEIIAIFFSVLFLYTGVSKIMEFDAFLEQLIDTPVLSPLAGWIAVLLPATEFAVTLLLIVPPWRLKGFYASLFLMLIFTVYVAALLMFSDELPCSCGGILESLSWPQHLAFNGMSILFAWLGIRLEKKIRAVKKMAHA